MRVFRVIFFACLILTLAGSAFAKNDKDKGDRGWGGKGGKDGAKYEAPEFNFNGLLKYELLVIAGGSVVLLERRRRRRRALVR